MRAAGVTGTPVLGAAFSATAAAAGPRFFGASAAVISALSVPKPPVRSCVSFVCACYEPMGRGTRTGHAPGTRNRHVGATRGRVSVCYGSTGTADANRAR
eukprot:3582194-Prymnesium_polylepis.1